MYLRCFSLLVRGLALCCESRKLFTGLNNRTLGALPNYIEGPPNFSVLD